MQYVQWFIVCAYINCSYKNRTFGKKVTFELSLKLILLIKVWNPYRKQPINNNHRILNSFLNCLGDRWADLSERTSTLVSFLSTLTSVSSAPLNNMNIGQFSEHAHIRQLDTPEQWTLGSFLCTLTSVRSSPLNNEHWAVFWARSHPSARHPLTMNIMRKVVSSAPLNTAALT